MRTLGFLVTGVMAAAIVACATGSDSSSTGSSNLDESADAAVLTDGGTGADATAPATDAAADATTEDASAPPVPTYDEVAPIIAASCGGCHDDQFASLDAVKEQGLSMLGLINRGRMPKGNPTFKTSPDGAKLVTYLTSSPDLQQ